jgi:DNA-binding GntR family transcriptional regulator
VTDRTRKATTRTDGIHALLRADILAGRRPPGDRLKFSELCAQYDVSVGVIRESLTRLEEQGLVHSEAHQGFEVVRLSMKDLRNLTDARIELEGLVLRRAVVEGDLAWESGIVSAHHVLERTPERADDDPQVSEDWAGVHAAFHRSLLEGCNNDRLRSVAYSLRDAAELYRRWSAQVNAQPARELAAEHRALVEACLARDVDQAAAHLAAHIQRTSEVLISGTTGIEPEPG